MHSALEHPPIREPFADSAHVRFDSWLREKDASASGLSNSPSQISNPTAPGAAAFTADQRVWLELMRDHIATSLSLETDDFAYSPLAHRGGLGRAHQLFGAQLPALLNELNEALAA